MEEIADTWTTRELLILRAALRRFDAGEELVDLGDVKAETDLSAKKIWAGVHALQDAFPPYIEITLFAGWTDDQASGVITSVSERARRELGSWPSPENMLEELIQALNSKAENAPEEQKGRLQSAAEVLGGAFRDIAVSVIAARIGQSI